MSKVQLLWGLAKVLMPEGLAAPFVRRAVVDGRRIDVSAQAASDLVRVVRDPTVVLSVAESRAQLEQLTARFDQPRPATVTTRDMTLPTGQTARLYTAPGSAPDAPLLLFLHGGGWIQGSIASHDGLCGRLCEMSGFRVLSYDYPLAPEQKFPAAPDDILALYRVLVSGETGIAVDPARLVVGGDSAGANLTAVLMSDLVAAGDPLPAAQVMLYPALDGRLASRSMVALADQPLLPRLRIHRFLDDYLPAGHSRTDPRFSPLFSDHLAGQPPAFILHCGHDPLWDDGTAYAEALRGAGVSVTLSPWTGQVHGFMSIAKAIPRAVPAARDVANWMKERVA